MDEEQKYLDSLNDKEIKSYTIAKNHLGSSFELRKSVGFVKWQKENMNNQESHSLKPQGKLS